MTESRRLDYAALNSVQRYTQWAVFRIIPGGLGVERADIISQTQDFFAQLESAGTVVVRGIYDISSIRAEADYMIWWHAEKHRGYPEGVQRLPPYDSARASLRGFLDRYSCTPPRRIQQIPPSILHHGGRPGCVDHRVPLCSVL